MATHTEQSDKRCMFCPDPEHGADKSDATHKDACPVVGCPCCPSCIQGHPTDKP